MLTKHEPAPACNHCNEEHVYVVNIMHVNHDYVMYWCGVHWVLCGRFGLFNFVIQTNEDEDNSD